MSLVFILDLLYHVEKLNTKNKFRAHKNALRFKQAVLHNMVRKWFPVYQLCCGDIWRYSVV
jgi:hypothetical protein